MLDHQTCINQQDNRIIERGPTDTELFLFGHVTIKLINIKMALDGIDCFEYSIPLGRLPMSVLLKILCEDLPNLIFYILFHPFIRSVVKDNSF